ncbi:hypothetical protein [Micromonospora endolithica]|uniref:Uncharacterized protein n=1 Tax=Micromonospora endolithica TaxID=230091 RepID=A0A3A9ZDK7_9ACTN|nr:hypothetical protein [Micromonospora endolithica]RKN46368.1 hypothetical protein D7223_15785 [Micromonospora endolithica]TWJ24894.1 hypothetical protein JD76_05052 [Micromonospora endolithica]
MSIADGSDRQAPAGVRKEPARSWGAGRPALAIALGLLVGALFGAFVYSSGLGRSSSFGAGSVPLAVLAGLAVTAGTAWTMFRKGW